MMEQGQARFPYLPQQGSRRMRPDVLSRLRQIGNDYAATHALYQPLLAGQEQAGVELVQDLAYGAHARQVFDLYRPINANHCPVVVFVHGGGFIRGDKSHRRNLGYFLARQGYVVALPNYRLAPDAQWPSGPEDVTAVWRALRQQAQTLGGDPDRIVLAGESAGAAHVAAAVLRTEFQPPDWRIAGAMLFSGPYHAYLEGLARTQFGVATPDPRNEPYFGADPRAWGPCSTVRHISAAPFPLLISYAELDMVQMQVQAGELFARLVTEHGFQPELLVLSGHNHFSPGYSVGTDDGSVSGPMLDFLKKTTAL